MYHVRGLINMAQSSWLVGWLAYHVGKVCIAIRWSRFSQVVELHRMRQHTYSTQR
jgi:hypothetical protein